MIYFHNCLYKNIYFRFERKFSRNVSFMRPKLMFDRKNDNNYYWGIYIFMSTFVLFEIKPPVPRISNLLGLAVSKRSSPLRECFPKWKVKTLHLLQRALNWVTVERLYSLKNGSGPGSSGHRKFENVPLFKREGSCLELQFKINANNIVVE